MKLLTYSPRHLDVTALLQAINKVADYLTPICFQENSMNKEQIIESETQELLKFFRYEHLPDTLKSHSQPFYEMAIALVTKAEPTWERVEALRKLLEAKDCAVRCFV